MKLIWGTNSAKLIGKAIFSICLFVIETCKSAAVTGALIKRLQSIHLNFVCSESCEV